MRKQSNHSQVVYARLRERIASGDLESGSVMSEATLAKEFGLSRTPVGEALRRLAHEGLVEQVPRYGTIVREVSSRELEELFEIREALEGMAAMKATERITPETLDELRGLCETIDDEIERNTQMGAERLDSDGLRHFLAADMAFHMLIIASAGNHRLCQMIEHTRSVSLMFKARRGDHSMQRVRDANQMHRNIVTAMEQRDSARAMQLVVDHIRTSKLQSLRDVRPTETPVSLGSLDLPEFVRQGLVGTR